jgi:hypothetical protein
MGGSPTYQAIGRRFVIPQQKTSSGHQTHLCLKMLS